MSNHNSVDTHLPLYVFFNALRKNNFQLGIEEYYTLLEAMHLGWGIDQEQGEYHKKRLLTLCQTLWLKPNQSKSVFNRLFEENYEPFPTKQIQEASTPIHQEVKPIEEPPQEPEPIENKNTTHPTKQEQDEFASSNFTPSVNHPLVKFVLGEASGDMIQLREEKKRVKRKFSFAANYFDLSKRQMLQICRFLPITQPASPSDEIDVAACVQQQAEKSVLLKPVFKRHDRIINEVLLLIDVGGSMQAFHPLIFNFKEAMKSAFRNKHYTHYYFYNVPKSHCYTDISQTNYRETHEVLAKLNAQTSNVIIISDAGAARGSNSDKRFRSTLRFILRLRKKTNKLIWLNPMPAERWTGNTAERIAQFIPMFELTQQTELQKAINSLRKR
ncbi:MAG: hypothetical protein ACPGJS_18840 [Flammeovirgaceae bacterium]